MPTIDIPNISIPEIYIPDVPEIYTPHYLTITKPPDIDVTGCTYQHRDIKNTGNRNLLLEDPNGVFTTCDFPFPSFVPLDYTPENMVITEQAPISNEPPPFPETEQPKIPDLPESPPPDFPPCPPEKPQFRTGDYRNDKRIERLVKYERSTDGSCDPIWEKVPFRESFIGTPEGLISTTVLGVVAGGSALLAPLIKKAISEIFKKIKKQLAKKKDKV
jgi:hypothetical protein